MARIDPLTTPMPQWDGLGLFSTPTDISIIGPTRLITVEDILKAQAILGAITKGKDDQQITQSTNEGKQTSSASGRKATGHVRPTRGD